MLPAFPFVSAEATLVLWPLPFPTCAPFGLRGTVVSSAGSTCSALTNRLVFELMLTFLYEFIRSGGGYGGADLLILGGA